MAINRKASVFTFKFIFEERNFWAVGTPAQAKVYMNMLKKANKKHRVEYMTFNPDNHSNYLKLAMFV